MASKNSDWRSQFEDLDITRDELNQIGEALKKEDFRKLLNNYFQEVTDPENQKLYESEITQLEKERGVDVTFIHPAAGYVIKTSVDGEKKAFINICHNDNIGKPIAKRESGGVRWSIPFSQAPPRDDFDKNKNFCVVYDVVFHPETIFMANNNKSFKQLVNDTAMNAIEDSFKVVLDKKNLIFPKIPFKGMKRPTVIRKKSKCSPSPSEDSDQGVFELPNYPYSEPAEEITPKFTELPVNKDELPYTIPKYTIKQRSNIDMQDFTNSMSSKMNAAIPSALVVEIDLPLIKSAVDVNLDVSEKTLTLSSEKPAKYKLDVTLPYAVVEGEGNAKFDSRTKKLIVTLSVKRRKSSPSIQQVNREDSGVDSDIGSCSRSTESSCSEDEVSKCDTLNQQSVDSKVEVLSISENKLSSEERKANESYRTNSADQFLHSDLHYSLPSYKCNAVENLLAFTFHVRNVEPESVEHNFLDQNSGIHLKFTSIGAGFFPTHYAFCIKFQSQVSVDGDSLSIEVWDNNVIAQLKLIGCDNDSLTDYFCGKFEGDLEKKAFDEPVAIFKHSEKLKVADEADKNEEIRVEVVKNEEDFKLLEITHSSKTKTDEAVDVETGDASKKAKDHCTKAEGASKKAKEHSKKAENDSKKAENDGKKAENDGKKAENDGKNAENDSKKAEDDSKKSDDSKKAKDGSKKADNVFYSDSVASLSSVSTSCSVSLDSGIVESEDAADLKCDRKTPSTQSVPIKTDDKGSPIKRCTFSDRPPLVHALSESLNDNSDNMKPRFRGILKVGRSLSESNVDDYHWSEDGAEGGEKVKKTVRFNNAISKKTFRRGSCILDQRKKNQRKSRNKKRAQQRRASESENSECETENLNDDIKEIVISKSDDETETSETSETQSDISESDDGLKKIKPDEMSLSRRNPHKKGKKKSARKSAATAKLAFTNNLMFELDV